MPKFSRGELHSGGPKGPIVKNRAQAIAIAASERDKEKANGGTYPESHFSKLQRKRKSK